MGMQAILWDNLGLWFAREMRYSVNSAETPPRCNPPLRRTPAGAAMRARSRACALRPWTSTTFDREGEEETE